MITPISAGGSTKITISASNTVVHPLVQGFWTKPQQLRWFGISGVLATLSGVFALF